MTERNLTAARSDSTRRALTLLEVVAATLIVGILSVATLNSLGAAMRAAESTGNRAVALGLASELMSEILAQDYREPVSAASFGPESGEDAETRIDFDDVDDYHELDEQPPRAADGTEMLHRDQLRRRVEVSYINPTTLQPIAVDQGAKRIRVTVEYEGRILAELIAVKTNH